MNNFETEGPDWTEIAVALALIFVVVLIAWSVAC
jgi:hypothetical protein